MRQHCQVCEQVVDGPFCPDGTCKPCHIDVSWEDCCDKTWNAKLLLQQGRSVEEIRRLYPEARI